MQPEVLFHVYLGPGNGSRWRLDADNYVGNINFFDAEFHDHGGGAMDEALGENFYSFDVTPVLQRMAGAGIHSSNSLKLTLIPAGRQPTALILGGHPSNWSFDNDATERAAPNDRARLGARIRKPCGPRNP